MTERSPKPNLVHAPLQRGGGDRQGLAGRIRIFGLGGGPFLAAIALLAASAPLASKAAHYEPSTVAPPPPAREFRGAWIATVANLDWPSTNDLTTAQQKAELLALLDRAVQLKLNAVIFQVRPACDALYVSSLEPWSEYLTGRMGQAPEPFYDPLALAVEQAHQRGLELHAWFNPYRARLLASKCPAAATHITKTHPQLVRQYGKFLWLDPGEKEVQEYSLRVILDVVKRYDIDGVHFDDYFYPYKEPDASGKDLDFPDEASWRRFGAGGRLSREDWRRQNVDLFIQRVYNSIKAAKPWVKFGISPFGIWRPGYPPQIEGYDAYAKLYADSRKWLANGWLDYFAPQLYWPIDAPGQSFPVLLNWWAEQNVKHRHLWPGLKSVNAGHAWKPEEIVNQIRLTRRQPGAGGNIHWDMRKALLPNNGLAEALEREVYAQPALVPASPWLERTAPAKPQLTASAGSSSVKLSWTSGNADAVRFWLLQTRTGKRWTTRVLPGSRLTLEVDGAAPEVIALTALDRCSNASRPAVLARRE